MSDAPGPETPWDVVKRMRAEGQPREHIVARLGAMGVSREDSNILLMEDPPKGEGGLAVDGAVAAVAILAAGPLLGGLALAAMSDRVVEREAAAPQAPLAATDTVTNRCAQHPDLASVATCARCGGFCCRDCAPKEEGHCAACEAKPAVHAERVQSAARRAGVVVLSFVALLLFEGLRTIDSEHAGRIFLGLGVFAVPLAALGVAQLLSSSRVPAILAIAYAGLLFVAAFGAGVRDLVTGLWFLVIIVLIAMTSVLSHARRAWKQKLGAAPKPA